MGALYNVPTINNIQYTLGSGYSTGGNTLTLNQSVAGILQAPGVVVVDRIDTNGNVTPSRRTYYGFTGVSSATLTGVSVVDGTDQAHSIGAVVEAVVDVSTIGSYYSALSNVVVPATGVLDTTKVVDLTTSQTLTNKTLTSPTLTSPTSTGTDSGTETLSNKTLNKPTINGSVPALTTDTDGATITFDMSASNLHTVTLSGNRTLAVSNVSVGQVFIIDLKQDATGSRLVTWFAGIAWAGGAAPTLTTTAAKTDSFGFKCTAANTYQGFVIGQNI